MDSNSSASPDPASSRSKDDCTPKEVMFLESENPPSARFSLSSVDFSVVNWLVGPGTTSSQLNTFDRLFIEQLDISKLLMAARRVTVKNQSQATRVSDPLTRDPLPTPQGFEEVYYPDCFAEKASLPFVIVEMKKPETNHLASHCHIFFMTLEPGSLYLCKLAGSFAPPKNNFQLGLLLPALGALHVVNTRLPRLPASVSIKLYTACFIT
ncbi:hypothetical protein EDD11_000786 [Mortierella claussenii]|nr:hypothetical protein EDD11_000786 [Mortierella claussenii]